MKLCSMHEDKYTCIHFLKLIRLGKMLKVTRPISFWSTNWLKTWIKKKKTCFCLCLYNCLLLLNFPYISLFCYDTLWLNCLLKFVHLHISGNNYCNYSQVVLNLSCWLVIDTILPYWGTSERLYNVLHHSVWL